MPVPPPGTATLNKGGNAHVQSVSCASAGNCGAGGYYTDASGHHQVPHEGDGTVGRICKATQLPLVGRGG